MSEGLSPSLGPSALAARPACCPPPRLEGASVTPSPCPRKHRLLHPSLQVLHDCQRYRSNIREIGDLWVGAGSGHGGLGAPVSCSAPGAWGMEPRWWGPPPSRVRVTFSGAVVGEESVST